MSKDTDGWLHEGTLVYRLTEDWTRQNRDEIVVHRADGSLHDNAKLHALAARVHALLSAPDLLENPTAHAPIARLQAKLDRALTVCRCAMRVIDSSAWAGASDEEVDLEDAVRCWREGEAGAKAST